MVDFDSELVKVFEKSTSGCGVFHLQEAKDHHSEICQHVVFLVVLVNKSAELFDSFVFDFALMGF